MNRERIISTLPMIKVDVWLGLMIIMTGVPQPDL